jgi:hypothetical protein
MRSKQIILLAIALLMPVAVFLFLKGFGKNEFNVPPLFTDSIPTVRNCNDNVSLPYFISPASLDESAISIDSLACISFLPKGSPDRLPRVKNKYSADPLKFFEIDPSNREKKECVYFLQEPFDVALVDSKGRIRGQYNSSKRDEVDRLITEIAIIFKKY